MYRYVNAESRIEEKYGSLDLNSMEEDAIVSSIDEMRRQIHQYEENINKKISKHYAELRPMPFESEKTVDNTATFLTNEIEQSKKFIEFQLTEIKEVPYSAFRFNKFREIMTLDKISSSIFPYRSAPQKKPFYSLKDGFT